MPDAGFAAARCTSKTRLALRGADAAGSGGVADTWSPVCGCGSITADAVPTDASNKPSLVASGGPDGGAYVDFKGDASVVDRSMHFGSAHDPFYFEAPTGGLVVSAVVRFNLVVAKTMNFIYSVRAGAAGRSGRQ